jgi:hypothetical protein
MAKEGSNRERKGRTMKRFIPCTIFAIFACCLLASISSMKALADTVTMNFTNVGGPNSGGVYTYPYLFNINSGPTVPLMCVSYLQEVEILEKWTATITPIGTATTNLTAIQEMEDAYLDSVVLSKGAKAQTISDAQWAAWEVGDSALVGNLPGGLDNSGKWGSCLSTAAPIYGAISSGRISPDSELSCWKHRV